MKQAQQEKLDSYKKKRGITSLDMAPTVGLEPTTDRLTADCSTTELRRNKTDHFITAKTRI